MPAADYRVGRMPAIEHDWPSIMKDAVDRAADNMKKASERYSIGRPLAWSTGINAQQWLDAAENYAMPMRVVIGIDGATFNERSKPVGLTKEHEYTDNDGDTIGLSEATSWGDGDVTALLEVTDNDSSQSAAAYVNAVDSIPMALNVLGYNRPSAEFNAAGATAYNGHAANRPIPTSRSVRDAHIAEALDLLIGADIFDQRTAEREARDAEQASRIAAKDEARTKLAEAVDYVARNGVSRVNADSLQIAVADYKKAVDAVGNPSAL